MTALAIPGVAYAYVNWSRWVADCPARYCRSALALTYGDVLFRCWDCGRQADIVWPPNVGDIERILAVRPDPVTRSWNLGESLVDLLIENVQHGIVPTGWLTADTGPLLAIVGDSIVAGELGGATQPLAVGMFEGA